MEIECMSDFEVGMEDEGWVGSEGIPLFIWKIWNLVTDV